jgi:phosphotransferase system, enzyme I, PtsP
MSATAASHETCLFLTLEEISQLISHCHDPHDTLGSIVRLIQGRFQTDVCSVYLLEPESGELVLGATVGLQPDSVGRVRMRLNEGLTGLVAERLAPVVVDDAFQHPRFKYFPEAGEDPYHSFLGVPLVEGGALQGVLVVQTLEPRLFSPNETRMLVTVASQLASLVSGAGLLDRVIAASHAGPPRATPPAEAGQAGSLTGMPLSPGRGLGVAYLVAEPEDSAPAVEAPPAGPEEERQRLLRARDAAREEITRLSQRISEQVGEDHGAILQAQLLIMQDRAIEQALLDGLQAGLCAEKALLQTQARYVAALQKVAGPLFQERVYDIKDVFRRMRWHLRPRDPSGEPSSDRLVLIAREASVMDLFTVEVDQLAAVVVEQGGPQSHAAILARSLGVPMVSCVTGLVEQVRPGRRLLVDGTTGEVRLDPPDEGAAVRAPCVVAEPDEGAAGRDVPLPGLPRVEANINLLGEAAQAALQQAAGIGLFRTEFLFLARRTLPTEEEQVGIYRRLLEAMPGRPVTVRTFDLRPDKLAHYSHWTTATARPFDWRLVLSSPPMQQLFKDQVRAVLRAAAGGQARLLIPLVTHSQQLDWVIETVARAREELAAEGLECGRDVPLGVMVEVAAAATLIDAWAAQVDFFALGTNDLIASALGVDRDQPLAAELQDPLHPGVLRLLHQTITAAHQAGRRVTVCGEMASDPEGALALAAFGVDALSVALLQIGNVRRVLAEQSPPSLAALAPSLTRFRTAQQARCFLRERTER